MEEHKNKHKLKGLTQIIYLITNQTFSITLVHSIDTCDTSSFSVPRVKIVYYLYMKFN